MSRYPNLDFSNGLSPMILSGMLEKDKQWGFVIIRCSYEDQAEWERCLSLIQERVRHQIDSRDINLPDINGPDVYENLVLTVIEDEKTLADASISVTTDRFVEWVKSDGIESPRAVGELQDRHITSFEGEEFMINLPGIPRHQYYIHATKEMIKSYSDDLSNVGIIGEDDPTGGAWGSGLNFLHVVSPRTVLAQAEWTGANGGDVVDEKEEEEERDADELGNLSKKVRGATLMDLYLKLVDGFDYFYDHE